jgi:hypothetical protein
MAPQLTWGGIGIRWGKVPQAFSPALLNEEPSTSTPNTSRFENAEENVRRSTKGGKDTTA